jgi:hypothetical protein
MGQVIDSFRGDNVFLCNFHLCEVEFEGLTYPSVEHAYQSAKTLDFRIRKIFTLKEMTPAQAKYLGRAIKSRLDWEQIKEGVMKACLLAKFSNPTLRSFLVATGNQELVEGNNWGDVYWGVCEGKGLNRLGQLLMEVRDQVSLPHLHTSG